MLIQQSNEFNWCILKRNERIESNVVYVLYGIVW